MLTPNITPWMAAIEAQTEALRTIDVLLASGATDRSPINSGWTVDRALLREAAPFAWSADASAAVLEASRSIPLDTPLQWNLNTAACWWHFAEPLPFETIRRPVGVRALAFGWLRTTDETVVAHAAFHHRGSVAAVAAAADHAFPPGSDVDEVFRAVGTTPGAAVEALQAGYQLDPRRPLGMPVVAWLDGLQRTVAGIGRYVPGLLQPSQTFEWEPSLTLGDLLAVTADHYASTYGPGGPFHAEQFADADRDGDRTRYLAATEGLARFVLAGLAWLQQKVLVTTEGHIERHARKRYAKAVGTPREVRVVELRRTAYTHEVDGPAEGETAARGYTCRFVVDGHWRNQPCGVHHGDRRLTWIAPHLKGPETAPFKAKAPHTVYAVRR